MSAFVLLRPWWLLALLPVLGVGWAVRRRAGGQGLGDWTRIIDPAMLRTLERLGRVERGGTRSDRWLLPLAAALAVLALAGPAMQRRDTVTFRNLDAVIFVVDVRDAVVGSDGWPRILTALQFAVSALGTRPAGLIVHEGDAFAAVDVTADPRELGQTLTLLDADTVPLDGPALDSALALAAKVLDDAGALGGDVIVVGEAEGVPVAVADIVARDARISVLGSGAALATAGQGRVFAPTEPRALFDFIAEGGRAARVQAAYPLLFWQDLGRWVLACALVPLGLAFRGRSA